MNSLEERQVLVAGGGTAGVVAAIAAARNGAKVSIVESNGYLGGHTTAGMLDAFGNYNDPRGNLIVKGIPDEIVTRLVAAGGSPGRSTLHGPTHRGRTEPGTMVAYEYGILKNVLLEMCAEAGIELLLYSYIYDTIVEGDVLKGVVIANKSGSHIVPAKVTIDCTGDLDVGAFAGADFDKPEKEYVNPATLMFRIGGVDYLKLMKYMKSIRDEDIGEGKDFNFQHFPSDDPKLHESFACDGFSNFVKEAKSKGDLDSSVRDQLSLHQTPYRKDEFTVNATLVPGMDATDPDDLVKGTIATMKGAYLLVKFFQKYVSGCENCYLVDTAPRIGVRESRHLVGEYMLTEEDVMKGHKFPDAIAHFFFGIDIPGGKGAQMQLDTSGVYDIPYRCLIPKKADSLLVAGRCISATRQAAGSIRMSPACMATGQAAGTAAALSIKEGVLPRSLDVKKLQKTMKDKDWL